MTLRVAVDWGTTTLRLWTLAPDGAAMIHRRSGRGMGKLSPSEFETAFLDLAGDLVAAAGSADVLICGMAGARSGWREAPYLPVPCAPGTAGAVRAETRDPRLSVHILPGLSQAEPADVMRGEETQIAGFLAARTVFDGVLCLPGTHTKWVRVRGGKVEHFRTVMTGELYALLSGASVLRLSMAENDPWRPDAFDRALHHSLSAPQDLTSALFSLRADSLLAELPGGTARSALSGLLIGHELAAMRPLWSANPIAIIGDPALSERYRAALAQAGCAAEMFDGSDMVLQGLRAAFAKMKET
ncbi:2-dehydro-3-deoxygalactonokinase [Defluviimonas sp. WL0002]|uniref:2-dehydro-3-deoxygalactonokinase n=1 Tax=Albidovulum marisflavi TaxID=2984159 RepID=A0ABT2ZCV0_9RHOB|nr:2-dehydro-3-deoxygalactonokinase [Defluviimonas sp. WL0002]MCV2868893.1 2-dehydro-3-deoxygalactonokinase [Defluviimonas sp. WL0002]